VAVVERAERVVAGAGVVGALGGVAPGGRSPNASRMSAIDWSKSSRVSLRVVSGMAAA
jgi:hypothetical protein